MKKLLAAFFLLGATAFVGCDNQAQGPAEEGSEPVVTEADKEKSMQNVPPAAKAMYDKYKQGGSPTQPSGS